MKIDSGRSCDQCDISRNHALFDRAHLHFLEFCISFQEGPRDFSDTPKWPQWPHLYTSYEATYKLKCLFLEKNAKNWFCGREWLKIGFLWFSPKVSNLRHMLLHNSKINVAIAVIFMHRKSVYDLQNPRYDGFLTQKTRIFAKFQNNILFQEKKCIQTWSQTQLLNSITSK